MTRTRNAAVRAARISIPALCAALLVQPHPAHAQSMRVSGPPGGAGMAPPPITASTVVGGPGATSITVAVGPLALFEGASALAFQLDYGTVRRQSATFAFEWHLPVTVSLPNTSADITRAQQAIPGGPYVTVVTGRKTDDLILAQVVPTARLVYGLGPRVALHADGGAGIGEVIEKIDEDEQSFGHTVTDKYTTALVVRLAAGMTYDVSAHLRISLQPLVVSWLPGTDFSSFSSLLGIAYRLQR